VYIIVKLKCFDNSWSMTTHCGVYVLCASCVCAVPLASLAWADMACSAVWTSQTRPFEAYCH